MATTDYHDLETWRYLVGSAGLVDFRLTLAQLQTWADDRQARMTCTFCGGEFAATAVCCPVCHDYKGVLPAIVGWSLEADEEPEFRFVGRAPTPLRVLSPNAIRLCVMCRHHSFDGTHHSCAAAQGFTGCFRNPRGRALRDCTVKLDLSK